MRLCINVDHIATLRQARGGVEPDPVEAAILFERAGADGIVCHLREDRRHINDRDVKLLRERITTKLDLEMGANEDIIKIAIQTKPDLVTLVPEKRRELTTEDGLDVVSQLDFLSSVVARFKDKGIPVSLFINPQREQVEATKKTGAEFIEIHTGEYAEATDPAIVNKELEKIKEAARYAREIGLKVNAGHGLNYVNVLPIVEISDIEELSIGHSIISRTLFVGIEQAFTEMAQLVKR